MLCYTYYIQKRLQNLLLTAKEYTLMLLNITGKNIEVTPGLKDSITTKLNRLDKYFTDDTRANIRLSVQKNHQRIEVTIPTKTGVIRAEQTTGDMYQSIDKVVDIIERQIIKFKKKLIDKKQSAQSFSEFYLSQIEEITDDSDEIKIAKVKSFELKPMDEREACLQMELLNHNFYVFTNETTGLINVVYKRADGTFGLIKPA